MSKKTFAYIDESGNCDLDSSKKGASRYFIVSAVLVSAEKQEELELKSLALRKKHFQTGEMKSSSIKNNNPNRRVKILNSIRELDFKFYALAVDKDMVDRDSGLQYKTSFIKFINGKLYSLLFKSYLDIHLIADEHGGQDFKKSFKAYIENNHKPDMFYKTSFEIVNSKNEILVQLSDFIVGTITKIYEGNSTPELNDAYIKLISEKALSIDEWPTRYQTYIKKDTANTGTYDNLIYTYSLAQAENFIVNNEQSDDQEIRLQVAVLRNIVFHSRMINKKEYVPSGRIIEHLQDAGHGEISNYVLRSKIIAPLRDSDVIITSSNKGYKIPYSLSDIEEFIDRVNAIVKPLLSRVGRASKNLKIASNGELEILEKPPSSHIAEFIQILDNPKANK